MAYCTAKLILNQILFFVQGPRLEEISNLKITDAGGILIASYDQDSISKELSLFKLRLIERTLDKNQSLYIFSTEVVVDQYLLGRLCQLTLHAAIVFGHQTDSADFSLGAFKLEELALISPRLKSYLSQSPRVGTLFTALLESKVSSSESNVAHVDYCYSSNGVLFINGWLPNFSELDIYIVANDFSVVAAKEDLVPQRRKDVTEHLTSETKITALTDMHGFAGVLARPSIDEVCIVAYKNGVLVRLFMGRIELNKSPDRIFPIALSAWKSSSDITLSKCLKLITPFIQKQPGPVDAQVIFLPQHSARPKLSIVVPFYREWRFIFSILSMVRSSPADWEWILVCDDPDIFVQLKSLIEKSPDSAKKKIAFVSARKNMGFGTANNVGVQHASSDLVLLMNSDIWINDYSPISSAIEHISVGDYSLIGFTLLFEDQSVQHDGLAYQRSADLESLYLVLHPGKGLPINLPKGRQEIVNCNGVTGALMLLQKKTYMQLGGFSDRYIGGDFEDADLCLSLLKAGKRIGLLRSDRIYHLERQSIRKDAANNLAFARTLVNCERFNKRWAHYLETADFDN